MVIYLSSALVCFQSKGVWSLNRRYLNVGIFHFSYLRDPEVHKFQIKSVSYCRQIRLWCNFCEDQLYSFSQTDRKTDRQTKGITQCPWQT